MTIPRLLDHVIIAGPDLQEVVRWFAERTGVHAAPGGAHPSGTANALVALTIGGERGRQYVELIGPDPDREDPAVPTKFGIAQLTAPEVRTYAIHPENIEATVAHAREHGYDPGDVVPMSRRTPEGIDLAWHLTRSEDEDPAIPFLIDWDDSPHPGLEDLPALELVSFTSTATDPAALRERLGALGLGDGVAEVEPAAGGPGVEPATAAPGDGADLRHRLTVRTPDGDTVDL